MDPQPIACCSSIGFLIGLPLLLVLLTLMLPDYVRRARAVMQAQPWRSFLLGLINFVFFALLGASIGLFVDRDLPVSLGAIPGGFAILVIWPLYFTAGLLVGTGVIGERLFVHITTKQPSQVVGLLRALLVGIAIMFLSLLIPIFGWLFFVGIVITGMGAALIPLLPERKKRKKREQSKEPAEDTEATEEPAPSPFEMTG